MRVDLVIPAHNEGHRIDRTLTAYRSRWRDPETRFLVALDGCTDATAQVVRRHCADPRVEMVDYPRLGKGGVIMETFRRSRAELVGFVDADCATPPAEMSRLAEVAARADGAIASRRHPASLLPAPRARTREVMSAGFAFAVRQLFRLPYSDTQCGAKVFRREVIEDALPLLSSRDFLFDVDLLLTARKLGYRIVELPTVWVDQEGSRVSAAADTRRMAASALRLWLHHHVIPVETEARNGGARANGNPWPPEPSPVAPSNGASRRRPDVALVAPYPRAGSRHEGSSGVASYAANLAHALADAGARVTVVAPEEPGEPSRRRDGPIRVERRFRRGPAALPEAAHWARATGAPVTHLQHELFLYGGPGSIPALVPALGAAKGPRTVVTMHHVVDPATVDRDFVRMHRVRAPVGVARAGLAAVQLAIRRLAAAVIVHEPAFAPAVPGARVIPHGLETEVSTPRREEARARLGLDSRLTALCFGFIAPYKGLEAALEAASLARDRVQLVIAGGDHPRLAGGDPYPDELRSRFAGSARFTGRVAEAEVPWWFAAADVALFMYPRPFASSGALALALAHDTPPLLSPALAETIGAPRALEAPIDPPSLARHLSTLAERRALLRPIDAAARELIAARSWPDVARRHLDIYEEVIDGNGAAGRKLRAG